ncbi:cellulose biosynthesis protein BcsN [Azospirillum halopraeferens]|uniref:cellulose biosynthesis protein BcsN n=1 Tax=Azospirillum halopraeferens TaxID=34010 RepID=UPI00040C09C0|nr:cellulose biosynthesis protein BcsN [Azospirillum halopraeferens]
MPKPAVSIAVAALAALAAAGCGPGLRQDTGDRVPTTWSRIPAGEVPVLTGAGGMPAAVGARARTIGALYRSYVLVLENPTSLPGENRLSIDVEAVPDSVLGALTRPDRPFPVPLYTEERLRDTLEREFPGLDADIAPVAGRNRYGDYDYAVAGDATRRCVLAWQLIEDRTRVLPETLSAVRLEWRMCGRDVTAAALLAPFDRLTLTAAPDILDAGSYTPPPAAPLPLAPDR